MDEHALACTQLIYKNQDNNVIIYKVHIKTGPLNLDHEFQLIPMTVGWIRRTVFTPVQFIYMTYVCMPPSFILFNYCYVFMCIHFITSSYSYLYWHVHS